MQTIQIELQGGTIYVSRDMKIEVFVDGQLISLDAGSIIFEYKDYLIAIENGAVYEKYYFLKSIIDPRIFIQLVEVQGAPGSYQRVLTVILYKIEGDLSMSGFGTVKLTFKSKLNRSILAEDGILTLKIERSNFSEIWYKYFEGLGTVEMNGDVEVSIPYDKLVLAILDVEVKAESIL